MTSFDLDHVGIAVRDLDRAESAYRRLGFTLTERSYHRATKPDGTRVKAGTGNHCFILRRGYVELIAPTDPGYSGRLLADLDRYEGLHLVALGTDSSPAAVDIMSRAAGAPAVARRVTRPFSERGQSFEAAFDIIDLPAGTVTEAHVFAIRHITPDVIWQPALMDHANGARELRSIALCADDPGAVATRLAALFGMRAEAADVALSAGTIHCVDAAGFAARFDGAVPPVLPCVAALSIGVAYIGQTAACLEANGVPFTRDERRLLVPPTAACGVVIEFVR